MTTDQIRKKFLDFFASKGHTIIVSDSLVPKDDPTVLFTTAGMQQFKRQFLGHIDGYTRAASCQKCLRTDDLDKIGKTNFHHTCFEMLGNFSFGDYFKKEAISWAWEFLTHELKLPKEKLWVSVYKDDKEAKEIWLKEIKIDQKKIVALGDHSNFWPADAKEKGPNGPCGPCSEIFYDYGKNPKCPQKTKCNPSCDCGRFAEIWNLVFTQFNRKEGGILEPLPSKNIDTGMWLERLAAVIQGKKSNFEIDIFAVIIQSIEKEIPSLTTQEKRVIADHTRAIVLGITDGVIPSNDGRGYIIKKLIIDITDLALRAGQTKPVIYKLVPAVIKTTQKPYPEIAKKEKDIRDIILNIETSYRKVRQERVPEFEEKITDLKKEKPSDKKFSAELGNLIFIFRDTYGLTVPTLKEAMKPLKIKKNILKNAWAAFDELMQVQKAKARASSKMTGDVFVSNGLDLGLPKTKFLGYEQTQSTSAVLKLFINDQKVNQVKQGDAVKIILDKTPFYAESGGQIGDSGVIINENGKILVQNTQKSDDIFIHSGIVEEGLLKTNEVVKTEIDTQRRWSIMRNHTATHLLQAALRECLGSHVEQQGSLVAEDRLRFDFTHYRAITKEELATIESRVNEMIRSCDSVIKEYLPIAKAKESGALAFFAEKYGEIVRVVSIANYSREFCGGTHLDFTGQIGLLKIISESAIAQGIRRIEAKTGMGALAYTNEQRDQLEKIATVLKSPVAELCERISSQTQKVKQLEKELEEKYFDSIKNSIDSIIQNAETYHETKMITHAFVNIEMNILRRVCDLMKQKTKSSIIILGARTEDSASILVSVSDDLIEKGIKADELIKDIAPLIGCSGG